MALISMQHRAFKRLQAMLPAVLLLVAVLFSAACQPGSDTPVNNADSSAVIGEVTRPELVEAIQWERGANTILFRAQVAGGETGSAFYTRNDIPYCTIYGDNRVVWTTTTNSTDDGVVYDLVSDEAIRIFVDWLMNEKKIYDYQTGVDLLPTPEGGTEGTPVQPVYEQLTLFVNGTLHQTDSFGGWDFAYFREVIDACRTISLTPIQFAPDGMWVSAQKIDYNPDRAGILWDSTATSLRLSEVASSGERRWITGANVPLLWEALRRGGPDVQFTDGSETFLVAAEVPNVTRLSPPAP
jgi:hypothetical protein